MEFRKIFIGLGILAVVLSYGALAQQWPFCQSGCTAKDVQVNRVYLVNMRFVGGVYYVDVYADFSVTAANRYCIMVAAGFSSSGDCSNLVTAWRMFGDLSQGTYTNQYVATITVATRDLWVCRLYAIWRNQPYPGCPTGDCNLYGVGSKCWESTATPYLIRGLDAVDDYYRTAINTPLYVPPPGVLGNDYYPDGVAELVVVSGPDYGTVTLNPDGSFTYTPPSGWSGTASFVYQLKDTKGFTDTATVYITVSPNQPVDAVDDSYSTSEDTPLYVAAPGILGNDSYPDGFGSLAVVTPPTHGSLTLNQDGSFTYTPDPNFCGQDSYIYRLCDTDGDCDEATVTIHVTCVNDAPVAQDDTYTTNEDTPLLVPAPGVLRNDYDVDGDPLTAVLVSGPAHGTLALNPDGSFTYTPAENFCGEDSFTYKAYDGALYSNVATVRITVTCVNDAPVAQDDSYTTAEDTPLVVSAPGVLGNDSDVDGDPLTAVLVSGPAHGTLTLNPDGSFTYTPAENFCGEDSFTYKAYDGALYSNVATVRITITCVNDAPVANDDEASVLEDSSVTIPVLGNDYDPDGDPLSVSIVSGPTNGRATVNPDGTITYTPNPDFCGTDSFTYKACDPAGACDTATVTIHVTCVNDAPVAQDDTYTTNEDTPLVVSAPGVLGNDSDVDGDPLTAVLVSGPAHGTLALNPDGSFTYTPAENLCGEDSFTYKAYDGALYSNVATVRITITCVNDAPVANDDEASVLEDSSVTIPVLGNDYDPDGDPLSVSLVSGPTNGRATVNPDGTITYTPNPDFCGTDSFTYKACDPAGACDTATVTIHVTCVNDAPVAQDDTYTTNEDTPLVVSAPGVLGNDSDVDGDPLTAVLVSGPAHGTLALNPDGSFTYTPAENLCGEDSFTYKAYDGALYSNVATVRITITCVNDAPVANDDEASVLEDSSVTIPVLGNDYDPDGDPLSVSLVSGPTNGRATVNPDGTITYTPNPDFCGTDSFTYKACDPAGACDTATVTIHVTCVNDAPVAQDDTYTTNEDTPLVVSAPGVLGNDSDVDGDPLTAVLVSGPAHGTLALNPDGSFTYTPAENLCGEDSFTYKAYDGALYSNVATVRITITCVNDAPVANDDEASVLEDSSVTIPVLGNDYDPDGDPLSVSLVSGPTNGRATVNPDGTITYTPNPDFCGTDSFTYKACDPAGACDTATVTIHVTCVNDAPVAQDDTYTTNEDTPLVVSAPGVLGNDSDVDGDPLTSVLVSGPAHGTLTLNPDGSFTYTPAENFCGEDSFTYKAYDGALYSNVATVRITVTCVNDAPVANDDEASVPEDSSVTIPVLGNDYDPDGDPLSVSIVSGPTHGRATVNPDGTITYTPNPDFCGTDSFTYKACDPAGACDTATVTIHVTCVNDAPVAQDDRYTTNEDTPLLVPAPGILGNDYDVDGDPLTSVLVSGPAHGTLTLNSDGSFTYTPAENFCGEDSFTYKAYDGALYSNVATVRITVTCVNDAPVANDDEASVPEDSSVTVPVLGNDYDPDGDPLSVSLVSGPANGRATVNPDGTITYTPNPDFCGTDSFTYKACDPAGACDTATVTIHVTCVNDAPVAQDDTYTTNEDTPLVVPAPGVLGNDYDVDGDPLTSVLVSGPAHGTLTLNSDGSFTYTPAENFCGEDSFTYKAYDGALYSNVATVRITVTCVNDAPVANDDEASVPEDSSVTVPVLGNDYDPDGDPLSVSIVSGPTHGRATVNPDGTITYTPNPDFCGTDSFTYKACDPAGACDTATVTIHVTCVNDAPVAQDDTYTTNEDTPLVVPAPGVLGNDYDVDGDPLTSVLVSGPAHGTLTLNSDGSFTYTPAENFCGEDSFTYKAYDGELYSNVATVRITVTCVNDAPVASDDEASVLEDSSVTIPVLGNDYDPDGDPLSVSLVSGPANGRATVNPDGTITYTPNPDFCGTDSFTYKACDPAGACDTATVTIHVTCVNDAPVAQDDTYTTNEDTPLVVPAPGVLGNDYDVDGDPLTSVLVSGPAHGTLTLNSDGSFTYTPAENFCGEDSFTYKAYDGALYSNVATVRITVTCVNDAPVANDDEASVPEDSSVTVPVLGNDYDPDGDPLSVSIVSGPTHGRATVNPDGTITYTPNPDFCGTDSFTYKACDPAGACDTATVTIHVTCVNDAPVAQDDTYTTNEDTPLVVPAPGVLGNDYDVDGDPLTSVLVSGPAHGTLTLNSDGSFTYTPAENFCGEDSFTYKAYDGELYSNVATVRITVTCVNDAPVASDDEASVLEDSSVTIPVLGNDYDPDGDPLSVSLVSGPANGRATVNPDGTITYTPNPDFCGTDSFTYKACDPAGACDTATVTIHVTCVNDAPVAQDDTYTTNEDTPLVVPAPGVLGNDYDVDGDPLTSVLVSGPAHGTLTLNSDGSFTYTPAENFCGEDSFTYKAYDGALYSNVATVRITVTCVNDAPVANDDEASVPEDSSVTVPVLGNDYDPDGDPLSVSIVSGPTHGRATVNPDGTITYTPNPDFCGTDSFTYKACDPAGACDTATVTIHVTCVNDAPVAQDDTYTTNEDTPLVVPAPGVLGNDYDVDGDPLTSVLVSGPAHGTLTLNSDGSFTYTPAENFCGEDSFTYKAYDGELYSNVATVRITVTCVNDAPVASDDEASVLEDSSVTIPVLGNDYDPDGDPLSVSLVSGPANGRATVNPDGTITYTPNPDFCGTDSFTYKACDPAGACDTATVTIHVTCVNDAPVAQDDSYTTNEDTPLVVPAPGVLGNDYDVDGDPLTSVLVSGPAHGTLTLNPDGSFTYTPNSKFYGTDTFTYRVFDGELYSNVATVTITVSFVNDPMEANDLSLRTCVNEGKAFEVQISDLDILWAGFTGYPVTFELISGPEHGTIAGDWNAVRYEEGAALLTLLYTPDANFIGSDELRIRAFDPYGQFVVFAVRITVESCGLTPAGAAGLVPGPVVIHEIAWAGTSASAEDQWIELLNLSDSSVNLEGWILRWRKKNPKTPEDLIWREIRLQGTIEPYGFFLLERGHDDVVKNVRADLIYPTVFRAGDKDLPLLFSVEGDVVELLNEKGELVDTANVDPQRLEGWAAGNTLPASMERKSPFLPDLDENWHTNLGIVSFGKDRKGNDLTATARNPNEPEILAIAGETLVVERGQKVALSRFVPNAPEAKVVVLRADVAGGAGALVPFDNEAFELRYDELVKTAVALLDTKALEPGAYKVVVTLGAGQYAVFSLVVR